MKKYYDAVIVGCGVAGCFAALHLPQEADILMITKADTCLLYTSPSPRD